MINDYNNSLTISSFDIDQLDCFISKAISSEKYHSPLTFSNFLPCPEIPNRYDWRLENWGTCAEPFNVEFKRDYFEFADYSFDTVGNSPTAFFERVSTSYPNLEFELRFQKPNEGIFGNAIIKNGTIVYKEKSETDILTYNVKYICVRNMIDQANTVIKNIELVKGLLNYKLYLSFLHNISLSITEEMEEILTAHFKEDLILAKEYCPRKAILDFFNELNDED